MTGETQLLVTRGELLSSVRDQLENEGKKSTQSTQGLSNSQVGFGNKVRNFQNL